MLSWKEFKQQALELVQRCKEVGNPQLQFEWRVSPIYPNVTIEREISPQINSTETEVTDQMAEADIETTEENASLPRKQCSRVLLDFHIVYSTLYQVPVAYFNYKDDRGYLLTPYEVEQLIPEDIRRSFDVSLLSQQDHPVLGVPYYHFHPCNTAHYMGHQNAQNSMHSKRYLVSWLSWVLPLFGLKINLLDLL